MLALKGLRCLAISLQQGGYDLHYSLGRSYPSTNVTNASLLTAYRLVENVKNRTTCNEFALVTEDMYVSKNTIV